MNSRQESQPRRVLFAYCWEDTAQWTGIARYAREKGWIVSQIAPADPLPHTPPRVDGIVCQLYDGARPDFVRFVRRMAVPKVELSNHIPAMRVARIMPDFSLAGRMATEHFLENGFRNFAYLGRRKEAGQANTMYAGMAAALAQRGFGPPPILWADPRHLSEQEGSGIHFDRDTARALHDMLAKQLLRLPLPVAILVGKVFDAVRLFDVCQSIGLQIPEQVALVTWAQEPSESEFTEVPFSSLVMDYPSQGYEACAALDRLMRGLPVPPLTLIPPKPLIVRDSSNIVAAKSLEVARALRHIQKNACTPSLSLAEIVDVAGVSRAHLYRLFQQHVGHSIAEQIRKVRLDRALHLLRTSKTPIREVARQCGYGSSLHLSRTLLRAIGTTPREYRKQPAPPASSRPASKGHE
jgi:LacI family transcriptional regulator